MYTKVLGSVLLNFIYTSLFLISTVCWGCGENNIKDRQTDDNKLFCYKELRMYLAAASSATEVLGNKNPVRREWGLLVGVFN